MTKSGTSKLFEWWSSHITISAESIQSLSLSTPHKLLQKNQCDSHVIHKSVKFQNHMWISNPTCFTCDYFHMWGFWNQNTGHFLQVFKAYQASFSQNASIFVIILIRSQGNFKSVNFESLSEISVRLYIIREWRSPQNPLRFTSIPVCTVFRNSVNEIRNWRIYTII